MKQALPISSSILEAIGRIHGDRRGAARREPREHEGGIALRDVLTLSLAFDHRLVDGEQGCRFLAEVDGILRDPARVLMLA